MTPILDPTTPTSNDVFEASKVRWQKLGITDDAALDDYVVGAAAYLVNTTGRVFSDWPMPTGFQGVPLATTPELIPIARKAMQMRVEQVVTQDQPSYVETAAEDLISSMSVGGYSETRRDTASLRGGRQAQKPLLNTHPGLNQMLEILMTDERYEFWLYRLGGGYAPSFLVEEVDWSMIGRSSSSGAALDPFAPWTMWG